MKLTFLYLLLTTPHTPHQAHCNWIMIFVRFHATFFPEEKHSKCCIISTVTTSAATSPRTSASSSASDSPPSSTGSWQLAATRRNRYLFKHERFLTQYFPGLHPWCPQTHVLLNTWDSIKWVQYSLRWVESGVQDSSGLALKPGHHGRSPGRRTAAQDCGLESDCSLWRHLWFNLLVRASNLDQPGQAEGVQETICWSCSQEAQVYWSMKW